MSEPLKLHVQWLDGHEQTYEYYQPFDVYTSADYNLLTIKCTSGQVIAIPLHTVRYYGDPPPSANQPQAHEVLDQQVKATILMTDRQGDIPPSSFLKEMAEQINQGNVKSEDVHSMRAFVTPRGVEIEGSLTPQGAKKMRTPVSASISFKLHKQ